MLEQRRLAKAVALADDIPELVSELRQRSARIQHLEVQVGAARRTPEELESIIKNVEATCRDRLGDLRAALKTEATSASSSSPCSPTVSS